MNVAKRKTERVDQKERTRQKLLGAARALAVEGRPLTIATAAARASIGEATAYRYYNNPRSLLRDALSIDWSDLNELIGRLGGIALVADRAQLAAEEMARFVLEREIDVRALFASTDQEPRDPKGPAGLPRASFRRRLVAAILHDGEDALGSDDRSIELSLLVIVSPHAVLTLRDAMPMKPDEIPAELGRMARRLFAAGT